MWGRIAWHRGHSIARGFLRPLAILLAGSGSQAAGDELAVDSGVSQGPSLKYGQIHGKEKWNFPWESGMSRNLESLAAMDCRHVAGESSTPYTSRTMGWW